MPAPPRSRYVELVPPADLAPYVRHLWVQEVATGEAPYPQPILPDGCIDLVAHADRVGVAGPATATVVAPLRPGTWSVGVQFRPGAAPPLLGPGADALRDASAPIDALWGRAGAALTRRAVAAADPATRLAVLVDTLRDRTDRSPGLDLAVAGSVETLWRRPGTPVGALAGHAGLSERQLRRRVEAAVGYGPRTLARVLRFQRFLRAARAVPADRRDLAALAAGAGYADQAHLTRESRRLGGLPPAALLAGEAERLAAPA